MPERRSFMQTLSLDSTVPISEHERTATLFEESQNQIHERTDRMFAWLMGFQWLFGIGAALWISPRTWIGATSELHVHVWAAIFLGGGTSGFPLSFLGERPPRLGHFRTCSRA